MSNAVVIAVILMIILCLLRLNVITSLSIGSLAGGLIFGTSLNKIISVFGKNIVDGSGVALSYALLGGFAALISYSGITDHLVNKITRAIRTENSRLSRIKVKMIIILVLLAIGTMSQNLISVRIAFILIVTPSLLGLPNDLKIDRRLIGLAMGFGLCWLYVLLPYDFGRIFHQIIQSGLQRAHYPIEFNMIWKAMLVPPLGYIVGLVTGLSVYHKPCEYKQERLKDNGEKIAEIRPYVLVITIAAIFATFLVQTFTDSTILGALAGVLIFFISGIYKWNELDSQFVEGIKIMSFIGIVILLVNGFAGVMNATGDIEKLVSSLAEITNGHKLITIIAMYIIGLVVTLGTGSSLVTIPVTAALFILLGSSPGLDSMALIALVGVAAALGDSGSPANDSTLGSIVSLNVDGQHDHIRDTCISNFLFYNVPLMILGTITATVLWKKRGDNMSNLLETFDMKTETVDEGIVVISMPATDKVKQSFGYLHGGVGVVLGETACSLGAVRLIDTKHFIPLGLEMNANHIHSVKEGRVITTVSIIHKGHTTRVWSIEIKSEQDKLTSIMRGTTGIKPLK